MKGAGRGLFLTSVLVLSAGAVINPGSACASPQSPQYWQAHRSTDTSPALSAFSICGEPTGTRRAISASLFHRRSRPLSMHSPSALSVICWSPSGVVNSRYATRHDSTHRLSDWWRQIPAGADQALPSSSAASSLPRSYPASLILARPSMVPFDLHASGSRLRLPDPRLPRVAAPPPEWLAVPWHPPALGRLPCPRPART